MKIYVSADMEGINGIVHPDQVTKGGSEYERARIWMTEEANALAEGLFLGGAAEVLIVDSHNNAQNIRFDLLDDRVALLQGDTRRFSMVHGLDESFQGMVLLGYHAKFGTPKAVMDHTHIPSAIQNVTVNGISYGELGMNALYGAGKGVPLLMVTGDQNAEREAKDFDLDCRTVAVKQAEGRFAARFLPKKESLKRIKETAALAASEAYGRKPVPVPEAIVLEVTFRDANLAQGALRVPGVEQTGPMSVLGRCNTPEEMMALRQIIFNAGCGFHTNF